MKTFSAKAQDVERQWWVIDAADQVVGDVAVAAARLLRGKHKAIFTPHVDTGDFVVIINADKARFTGNKEEQKYYHSYSGWIGGAKRETVAQVRQKHPQRILERAVHGMIPKNRLGRQIERKLKVYAGGEHPHEAQQPKEFTL